MRPELRNMSVDEIIIHDLPKKISKRRLAQSPDMEEDRPVFSQVPSFLSADIRQFFIDKIVESIGSSSAVDIIFDIENETCVKGFVEQYFDEPDEHITPTMGIVQHLFEIQNAQNSGGLLLFIESTCQGQKVLSVLKLEKEEGVRLVESTTAEDKMTFDVEYIQDLMLTKRTKLFKIVLFYKENEAIKGVLCDKQRGYNNKDVADFFINKFLGCKFAEDQAIVTKKFYDLTMDFINNNIQSPVKKGALMTHLLSELNNRTEIVNVRKFATNYIDTNLRDEFETKARERGISTSEFQKDICLIENKIKRIQYDFSSGISVIGTNEAITEKVKTYSLDSGEVKLEVIDNLKKLIAK